MSDWCPFAKRDEFRDGGSFTGGPPKGLLHTTEGSSYAGARSVYASKSVAPHFTISFEGGRVQLWQHVPVSRASRSLRNASGGPQTNRDHVIQIEIVGHAHDTRPYQGTFLEGLKRLMRWIEENAGVPRRCGVEFKAPPARGVRLSGAAWDNYSGWLGHQHAPENDHVDPGAIPIAALLGQPQDDEGEDDLPFTREELIAFGKAGAMAALDEYGAEGEAPKRTSLLGRLDADTDGIPLIKAEVDAVKSLCTSILEKIPGGTSGGSSDLDRAALAESLRAQADLLDPPS